VKALRSLQNIKIKNFRSNPGNVTRGGRKGTCDPDPEKRRSGRRIKLAKKGAEEDSAREAYKAT